MKVANKVARIVGAARESTPARCARQAHRERAMKVANQFAMIVQAACEITHTRFARAERTESTR